MATWPATLPSDPLLAGFSETVPDTTARTQMDAGPDKIRRRFTAAPRPMTVPLSLTTAQVATLDTFYVTTLTGGSLAFDWTHPRTAASVSFRFLSPPVYVPDENGYWSSTLQLEVMP